MNFPLLIILISLMEIAALVFARYYVEKKVSWMMYLSLFFFGASSLIYIKLMAFAVTALINVLAAAFSSIFITFFYFIFFKERITKGQWIGILVVFIGILMLEV